MRGFVTAFRTLTSLPLPGREADSLADALPFFPVVGAIVGGAVASSVWLITSYLSWPAGAAVAAVALSAWLTRNLHLDGLADVSDALGAGGPRDRMFKAMKDSRIGAFGAVAIVLDSLIKFVALSRLAEAGAWGWIFLPFVLSRTILVQMSLFLSYATSREGIARAFVADAKPWHLAAAVIVAGIISFASVGLMAVAAILIAAACGLALTWWARRTFGGVTGDLLGAVVETTETLLLMLAAGAAGTAVAVR